MAYASVLARIDAAITRGDRLDEIDEHVIEPTSSFSYDEKAALWLYAFARIPRPEQKRYVRQQFAIAGM